MAKTPEASFRRSTYITKATLDKHRFHKGDGDMWPITWAADGNLYGGAGDNLGSPMNFWRIEHGVPWGPALFLVDNMPVDVTKYCRIPPAHPKGGIKPAGLLSVGGTIYFAVEAMNYGDNPAFNRQHNVHGWIITTTDYGKTWNREATPTDFFTGRLCSCHFIQFGRDYEGALDEFVYATFPAADDGQSYWCNGDCMLLGRVPKDRILDRSAWEFYTGLAGTQPQWNRDDAKAVEIFRYPLMTGENHVVYNRPLGRFIMGNFSFYDPQTGKPRPYHQERYPQTVFPSQLTLFEAPHPWGPWSLFYRDDNWGTYGDYQPNFPTKWISEDGRTMYMVSSGTWDDYNFTFQQMTLEIASSQNIQETP